MKNKKILVVTQHYWPENFRINDITDYLVEHNCDIDVLCGIPNYPKGKFFEGYSYLKNKHQNHNGINVNRVFELPRGNNSNLSIFLNYISFPLASLFHIPKLLTLKYDKIFLFQTSPVMMAIAGIIVGRIKKTETTMYVLDLWPENLFSVLNVKSTILRKLAARVSLWHYNHVNKLIVLSEKMKSLLIAATNLPEEKIIVIPQVCEKIYEKDIQDKTLSSRFKENFNIVFTGNISPAQSFETIVDAAKKLKISGIKDINWIIVGDGMYRGWLEDRVKKAGLSDCFYFEGMKPITDIPKYTTVADMLIGCLVKSDLLEATIPAKVMSYIAAGRPIVLAMDGEVQDLINKKIKCGYAGPTNDVDKLVNNIKKVRSMSKIDRAKMGKRAKNYHFKHFERNMNHKKLYNFVFG